MLPSGSIQTRTDTEKCLEPMRASDESLESTASFKRPVNQANAELPLPPTTIAAAAIRRETEGIRSCRPVRIQTELLQGRRLIVLGRRVGLVFGQGLFGLLGRRRRRLLRRRRRRFDDLDDLDLSAGLLRFGRHHGAHEPDKTRKQHDGGRRSKQLGDPGTILGRAAHDLFDDSLGHQPKLGDLQPADHIEHVHHPLIWDGRVRP